MSEPDASGAKQVREQSTVQFPYSDLEEAIGVVRAIHQGGGMPMERDQIAARMDQKPTSGAFITKLSAARMFGLTETIPGSGKIRISALGHEVIDTDEMRQRSAKATAFLNVELYAKMHEQFKNRLLPPRPHGLDQAMVEMGVAAKQRTNARYAFDRSAKQAGYFDHGQDKLVAPVGVAWTQQERSQTQAAVEVEVARSASTQLDGVITALIGKLPSNGPWPTAKRAAWLKMMNMAFDMAYGPDAEIEIAIKSQAIPAGPVPEELRGGFFSKTPVTKEDDDETPF